MTQILAARPASRRPSQTQISDPPTRLRDLIPAVAFGIAGLFVIGLATLSGPGAGDQVLVIKYNTTSQKYSVWTATVDMTTSNGSTYKTLTPGDNSSGNVVFNGTTSYEDALAAYQKALTARGLT